VCGERAFWKPLSGFSFHDVKEPTETWWHHIPERRPDAIGRYWHLLDAEHKPGVVGKELLLLGLVPNEMCVFSERP
jgi:hypothetical protein